MWYYVRKYIVSEDISQWWVMIIEDLQQRQQSTSWDSMSYNLTQFPNKDETNKYNL